jgi:hypothetical protein
VSVSAGVVDLGFQQLSTTRQIEGLPRFVGEIAFLSEVT